jgi:hypothetical protein
LPPNVARQAVQLNVASREAGWGRIITADRVEQLGVEGIRRVVTLGDPGKVALALVRELLMRTKEGPERQR